MGWFSSLLRKAKYYSLKMLAKVFLPTPTQRFNPDDMKKILIYGEMGIGNMIMFTPTIRAIRRHFSGAHITLLVAHSGSDQVVGNSLVDEIIKVKPEDCKSLTLALNLRGMNFDLLISNFHGLIFRRITVFNGIPYRVGHCSSPDWQSSYDYLFNIKVKMEDGEHEIDRDLHIAEALDIKIDDRMPVLDITDEARRFAEDFFSQNGISADDLVVGIHLCTWRSQTWKHWDMGRLAQVCDQLMDKYQAKLIILGSPQQREELKDFLDLMKHQPIIAVGKADLKQAFAIVEKCDFMICGDTGLMHISAVVGTPVIAIFGPTDYTRTSADRYAKEFIFLRKDLPCSPCYKMYGEDEVVKCQDRRCLDAITVQDVMSAAEKMIKKIRNARMRNFEFKENGRK